MKKFHEVVTYRLTAEAIKERGRLRRLCFDRPWDEVSPAVREILALPFFTCKAPDADGVGSGRYEVYKRETAKDYDRMKPTNEQLRKDHAVTDDRPARYYCKICNHDDEAEHDHDTGFKDLTPAPPAAQGVDLEAWFERAKRDDCFVGMVPSDLRQIVSAGITARAEEIERWWAKAVAERNHRSELAARHERLRKVVRQAQRLLDEHLGDTDLPNDDRPDFRAFQVLAAALRDEEKEDGT